MFDIVCHALCVDIAEKDNSGLIASVKSTSFSDSDLQSLIDILLSKQGAAGYASDWNKVRYYYMSLCMRISENQQFGFRPGLT